MKRTDDEVWVIETKGREDLDDPRKWERLKDWVADATTNGDGVTYRAMFAREEEWNKRALHSFAEAEATFELS